MALNGIDISSWQDGLKPASMTTTDFIIVKATGGTSYTSSTYATQAAETVKAGKLLGLYHFARESSCAGTAEAEAKFFYSKVKSYIGTAVMALDYERDYSSSSPAWCKTFLDTFYQLSGVRPVLYINQSTSVSYDWSDVAKDYKLWLAQYASTASTGYKSSPWRSSSIGAWSEPVLHQYTSSGRITGYGSRLDLDIFYGSADDWAALAAPGKGNTMTDRKKVVNWLQGYVGITEGGTKHKALLATFNSAYSGYTMTTSDAWCAAAVSAAFIGSGLTSIFPCVECSCPRMISKAQSAGIWVEDDSYIPSTGDVIMYDWDDSGSGDNTGTADHVGLVASVANGKITVLEGNVSDTVGYRTISVNGRYIRGYITPKYSTDTGPAAAETVADDVDYSPSVAAGMAAWENSSGKTCTVYADSRLTIPVGMLAAGDTGYCFGRLTNKRLWAVAYTLDSYPSEYKIGYVANYGGTSYTGPCAGWQNWNNSTGSTCKVYADTRMQIQIGSLAANDTGVCCGKVWSPASGRWLWAVAYTLDSYPSEYKIGYVDDGGGTSFA